MFAIHRIIFCRFACPPIRIISSTKYFCKKKFCGTNGYYHGCFLYTEKNQLPFTWKHMRISNVMSEQAKTWKEGYEKKNK